MDGDYPDIGHVVRDVRCEGLDLPDTDDLILAQWAEYLIHPAGLLPDMERVMVMDHATGADHP